MACSSDPIRGLALAALTLAATALFAAPPQDGDFESLLRKGFALHQQADYTAALPILKHALQLQPHEYHANLLVGIDLLRTGQARNAVAYLTEASRLELAEDIPLDYLIEAQASIGHFAEAARVSGRAVELAPSSEQAVEGAIGYAVERFRTLSGELRGTTSGLAAEKRLQALAHPASDPERMHLLESSATIDPEAPGIWSDLALVAAARGNEPKARDSLRRAMARNANDIRARIATAILAARAGDWDAASEQLNAASMQSPVAFRRSMTEWPSYLKANRGSTVTGPTAAFFSCAEVGSSTCAVSRPATPPGATASITSESRNTPPDTLFHQQRWELVSALPSPAASDGKAWFQRGAALAEIGSWSAAAVALEHALEAGASPVYTRYLLCWSYAQRTGETMRLLQDHNGDAAMAHMIRGDVLLHMQSSAGLAAAEYTAALAARPDDPNLLERLAEAQRQSQQPDAAIRSAEAALRTDPYRFAAMQTIALIALEQRRYSDALPYLKRLNRNKPSDAAIGIALGTALARTGDAAGAVDVLVQPLQLGYPDQKGSLHALLGDALRKTGRTQAAAAAFAMARTLSEQYQKTNHAPSDEPQP